MKYTIRDKNNSTFYRTGSKHNTIHGGEVTVIAQLDTGHKTTKGHNYYPCFLVEFEDGTQVVAWNSTLKSGLVRNPNLPQVHGAGIIGQEAGYTSRDSEQNMTPEYSVWSHVVRRCCASDRLKDYPTYKNVTICDRWLYFPSFCRDIKDLDNYDKWVTYGPRKYQLDKDIKQQGKTHKVYSKDTCMFVTAQENSTESNQRNNLSGKTYLAIRLADEYEEIFYNQNEFARKYNLQASNIGHILNKTQKRYKHKGWTFKIISE